MTNQRKNLSDTTENFKSLRETSQSLSDQYKDGLVFIGGLALYFRMVDFDNRLAEATHDGDFFLSMTDLMDLREHESCSNNNRLSKYQMIKKGHAFDVYVEYQSRLAVPYDDIRAQSEQVAGVRVACLEHLLALKMRAFDDRKGTPKGEKDERDIVRIALLIDRDPYFKPKPAEAKKYLTKEDLDVVQSFASSPTILRMVDGNPHAAKPIRESVRSAAAKLRAQMNASAQENKKSHQKTTMGP